MRPKYFLILLFLISPLYSMEPKPSQEFEIPTDVVLIAERHTKTLEKYLNNIPLLIEELHKDFAQRENVTEYATALQMLASFIFWHNELIKKITWYYQLDTLKMDLNNSFRELKEALNLKMEAKDKKYIFKFNNLPDSLIANIISNPIFFRQVNQDATFSLEDSATLYSLMQDPDQDIWLRALGCLFFIVHYRTVTDEIKFYTQKIFSFFISYYGIDLLLQSSRVSNELVGGTWHWPKEYTQMLDAIDRLAEKKHVTKNQIRIQEHGEYPFVKKIFKEARAYPYFFPLQNDLYKTIYRELSSTLTAELQKNKNFLALPFLKIIVILTDSKINIRRDHEALVQSIKNSSMAKDYPSLKDYMEKMIAAIPIYLPKELTFAVPPLHIANFPSYDCLKPKVNGIIEQLDAAKKVSTLKKNRRKPRSKQVTQSAPVPASTEVPQEIKTVAPELHKIKQSPYDNSFVLEKEDTASEVIIHDPRHNTITTLFKPAKKSDIDPAPFIPLKYTDWVSMWFINPQEALQLQGYKDPKSTKYVGEAKYQYIIDIHDFARLVDDYISQLALVSKTTNKKNPKREDFLITIPGRMQYADGTQETGIYSYLIDSENGQCYHRMFEPQSGTKIISDLFEKGYFNPDMTGYYEVFFPPLEKK